MSTTLRQPAIASPAASAAVCHGLALLGVTAASWTTALGLGLSSSYVAKAALVLGAITAVVLVTIRTGHPYPRFGPANTMTTARATLVAMVAALIGETPQAAVAASAVALGLVAVTSDGLDGWLARRSAMASRFGARFDMEIDALLILALSVLAWQHGKAGAWVVLSGLIRYAFVAAAWPWPWMRRPLLPSRRRQTTCVVQIGALLLTLVPAVAPPASTSVAAAALALLAWSFLVDIVWLARQP